MLFKNIKNSYDQIFSSYGHKSLDIHIKKSAQLFGHSFYFNTSDNFLSRANPLRSEAIIFPCGSIKTLKGMALNW